MATPVFLPGESHRQMSLEDYSPWGCKESNMTDWPTLSLSTFLKQKNLGIFCLYFHKLRLPCSDLLGLYLGLHGLSFWGFFSKCLQLSPELLLFSTQNLPLPPPIFSRSEHMSLSSRVQRSQARLLKKFTVSFSGAVNLIPEYRPRWCIQEITSPENPGSQLPVSEAGGPLSVCSPGSLRVSLLSSSLT